MGANLVPVVRNFYIANEQADDHSVEDGCVAVGMHRLLRFDFLSHNIGDADLVVGKPEDHPEWFVLSASHGHYHLKDFNEFRLSDGNGVSIAGAKQAFCLMDIEHPDPWGPSSPKFTCSFQGVSAGWADLYHAGLACQFVVIDGVPDGLYVLTSTTNAQHMLPEDTYADNTIHTWLRISGDTVHVVELPDLRRYSEVVRVLFGVVGDGGGVVIGPNGIPIPIDPWGPLTSERARASRDLVAGVAIFQLASLFSETDVADEIRGLAERAAGIGERVLAARG